MLPDEEDPEQNDARINALYGTLMAGGYGVEWYFGYASPQSDLTCEDFRSRDLFWDQNRHARHFFENYLPFWKMVPADGLTRDSLSFCLALVDEVYAVYLPQSSGGTRGPGGTSIQLGDSGKQYSVRWFNPRTGEAMLEGSTRTVLADGMVQLGDPPPDLAAGHANDWLVLIQRE